MNDKLLKEIHEFCESCGSCLLCPEEECILYRLEQIIIESMSEDERRESKD